MVKSTTDSPSRTSIGRNGLGYVTWVICGTIGMKRLRWIALLPESDMAPKVRP